MEIVLMFLLFGAAGVFLAATKAGSAVIEDAGSNEENYSNDKFSHNSYDEINQSSSSYYQDDDDEYEYEYFYQSPDSFDDDTSSDMFEDDMHEMACPSVNPANGMPMVDCSIDVMGNPYGTDFNSEDPFDNSSDMFDDSSSMFGDSSSMLDDTFDTFDTCDSFDDPFDSCSGFDDDWH